MIVKDYYGNDVEVIAYKREYLVNDNLAVFLATAHGGEPWATLTKNLGNKLPEGYAYVDVNNCPWAPDFIEENGLGEFAEGFRHSGFCDYPLYKFDLSKLEDERRDIFCKNP